jgi:hypothetical protein
MGRFQARRTTDYQMHRENGAASRERNQPDVEQGNTLGRLAAAIIETLRLVRRML